MGGIAAKNSCPADFLLDNLKIQTNLIETAWRTGVRSLLFLGSSFIDPNSPSSRSARTRCVLPALIRRFHEAAEANAPSVTCWCSGTPLREFLHVDDLGEACVFALEHWQPGPEELQHLNVGTGVDVTIRALAEAVAEATGFQGEIHWDASKPDGTPKNPKKQLDLSRLAALGWQPRIPLAEGLRSTVALFREQVSLNLARL